MDRKNSIIHEHFTSPFSFVVQRTDNIIDKQAERSVGARPMERAIFINATGELCATNNCNLLTGGTAGRENFNCNFARRDAPHVAGII